MPSPLNVAASVTFRDDVLMLVLGLRRGELLGLAWQNVDLEKREASIRWQVQRIKGELLRRRMKTATSDAPLPLPDICVQALGRRSVIEARWRLAAGEAWAGSGLVLTTRLGDPLDPRNFHRYFKARAAKAGVPRPRHATDLRLAPGGTRRTPPCGDGDPAAKPDRGHDGHLLAGVLGLHAGGVEAAREPARGGLGVRTTAVLFWGTTGESPFSVAGKGL